MLRRLCPYDCYAAVVYILFVAAAALCLTMMFAPVMVHATASAVTSVTGESGMQTHDAQSEKEQAEVVSPIVAESGAAKSTIRLFETVEFRGMLKNMPKWQRVVTAENRSRTFDQDLGKFMRPSLFKQWQQLAERTKNVSVLDKTKAVTVFFNRWPYKTDREVYKLEDYWATPAEFMLTSGDCEDYAITKFYALIKLGVPPESMRIVALKDVIRNLAHAILVVYIDDNAYVLDNLTDMVLTHERYKHYWPQYSVNEVYRWAHVRPRKK